LIFEEHFIFYKDCFKFPTISILDKYFDFGRKFKRAFFGLKWHFQKNVLMSLYFFFAEIWQSYAYPTVHIFHLFFGRKFLSITTTLVDGFCGSFATTSFLIYFAPLVATFLKQKPVDELITSSRSSPIASKIPRASKSGLTTSKHHNFQQNHLVIFLVKPRVEKMTILLESSEKYLI